MVKKEVTVLNATGLHARPASMFVQTAGKFKSKIFVIKEGNSINAKSIMGIMTLAANKGSILEIEISGKDEAAAMDAITALINNYFEEGE